MNRPDGYRYLRQYRRGPGGCDRNNYALFEVRGGRARRVGTARDYQAGRAFIFGEADAPKS
jgi:hypothetical protein